MTSPHHARPSRRRLSVIAGLLAVVVLGAGLVIVAVRRSRGSSPAPRQAGPAGTEVPSSSAPSTTAAKTDPAEPEYITTIKQQVADLRGLAWKSPLKVEVVSRNELSRRAQAANERDRHVDRMAGDADSLRILHLIPADLDYTKTIDDLLSGVILGYYDPLTKELLVGDSGGGGEVDGSSKVALAHELDHALTDQWFDFGSGTQALDDADREEEASAFSALIEGDAKFLEARFADRYLSEEEQLSYALGGLGSADTDTVTKVMNTPAFILHSLYFPYSAGLAFVKTQAGDGPDVNAGINAAYRRPPTSTEQILHPETYAAGQNSNPPALPDVAATSGCEARRRNVLGEFAMGELLGTELDDSKAKEAAAGWNGDVFETVRCGTSLGLVERWQADTDADAARLAGALVDWAPGWADSGPAVEGRFSGPAGTGRIVRSGSVVTLVLGADPPTADRLASAATG